MESLVSLAQVEVPPWLSGWLNSGGIMVMIPLFSWWIWYTTSISGPRKDREHREHVKELNTQHAGTIENIVTEFRAENKEHRAACAHDKQMLIEQLTSLGKSTRGRSRGDV